jgi:hypothetical protein
MECKWRRVKSSLNDRNKRSKQEGKKKSWKELTRVLSLHSITISVAVALFNCGKLRTLISLVTLPWLLWLENVSNYETHCCTNVRWTLTRKLCGYHGYTTQLFMLPRWLVQVLHPPQKFERPPFWNAWWYRIRKCVFEVAFNGMTSLLNFVRIYRLLQILLCGDTDRQISLDTLSFFMDNRIKTWKWNSNWRKYIYIYRKEHRIWSDRGTKEYKFDWRY